MKSRIPLLCASFVLLLAGCSTIRTTVKKDSPAVQQASSSMSTSSNAANPIRAKLIDALLEKRLRIEVIHEKGGRNGCELQEPYYWLKVSRHVTEPYIANPDAPDGGHVATREKWEDTDIADGIALIVRTGEVHVMDVCLE